MDTVYGQLNTISAQLRVRIPLAVKALLLYIAAITIFGKGPTYLFYPPIFWGEVTMAIMLVWGLISLSTRGLPDRMLGIYSVLIGLFLLYGGILAIMGLPKWGLNAVRDAAVVYYAVFFFIGLYLTSLPKVADWLWRKLLWVWIISMVWFTLEILTGSYFSRLGPVTPWRDVYVFSGSSSENWQHMVMGLTALLLGFPVSPKSLFKKAVVLAMICLVAIVFFVGSARGIKLAVLSAVVVGFLATVNSRKEVWPAGRWAVGGYFLAVILLGWAIIAGPGGLYKTARLYRFREIGTSAAAMKGTALWRYQWWANITKEVNDKSPVFGFGFGRNLGEFNPTLLRDLGSDWPVRSPHCYSFTILGRMGYLGLAMWLAIFIGGVGMLFRRVRAGGVNGRTYTQARMKELAIWLIFLVATFVNGSFGVLMEGPVLGIWFWFALGFAIGRSSGLDGVEPVAASKAHE